MAFLDDLFALTNRVAVITGGTGGLGSSIARGLAGAGARVVILGRDEERGALVVRDVEAAGGQAMLLLAEILDTDELKGVRDEVLKRWGQIDILVNAAGGGLPGTIVTEQTSFFDLPRAALESIIDLNLLGTLLPTQVFGTVMAQRGEGSIVNISSVSAPRPLTKTVGYGAAKAGVEHFTRWLAVETARRYGSGLRVNCIEPGFFLTPKNRPMLANEDGSLNPRGQDVLAHTPMGRFGETDALVGAAIWLCSPSASFVTGTVVTVDGGFTAFAGV